MINSTTTCEYSNPLVVSKSGEVISFVYPTASNQNFQYKDITCQTQTDNVLLSSTTSAGVANGFTYGEIITTLFLFVFLCIAILVFGIPKLKKQTPFN